ncbi:MAG: PKD domain-containing protein [Candidatus Bathyarchaeota archaeon]|nr:PKD domain-containing protein [Candidatus Bathyarchaeum sp.]
MKFGSGKLLILLLVSGFVLGFNVNFCTAQDYTEVGGIINSDTTWTLENSPYLITTTVQIPEGVVLTIQSGVTVNFAGDGDMFLVHGTIFAHGTVDNKISFNGNGATTFFNAEARSAIFDFEYCVIKDGGRLWQITGGNAQVILRYSELVNITSYSQFSQTKTDNYIEFNIFMNTAGFTLYDWWEDTSAPALRYYIRYNLVKGNKDTFLDCISNRNSTEFIVNYNSFVDPSGIFIQQNGGNHAAINAIENYWGTSNTDLIDSLIYDANDDINSPGAIEYLPILTEPHPDAPTLPIIVNFDYSPAVVYVNEELTLQATASYYGTYSVSAEYAWDFGDGVTIRTDSTSIQYTYDASGSYDVTLTVTDEHGFTSSTTKSVSVVQDETAPSTVDDYEDLWYKANIPILLTASDQESGVAETYYRINGGATKTVSADGYPFITTEGANNILEYWSVDVAGNEEPVNTVSGIKLDKSSPVSSINLDGTQGTDGWFTSDVTVSLLSSDAVSEVDRTEYNLDNSAWDIYTAPFEITDEEATVVYYRSIDQAGNVEATKTETVKLDKTVPFGSVLINDDATYTNLVSINLTLSGDDDVSGISQMRFSNSDIEWSSWETYSTSKAWTLVATGGTRTVYVQFKDNAGLVSESYTDTIILDTTKPTADAGQDQTVTVDMPVTFNASASSDNLAIVSYEWDFGDNSTGTGETTTHTYTAEGEYTVALTVKDASGNTGTHQITVTAKLPEEFPLFYVIIIILVVMVAVAAAAVFLWKNE